MELCDHWLDPQTCAPCLHGPLPDKVVKEKVSKPKPKLPVVKPDLAEKFLQEYLAGVRCIKCDGLRTGAAFQGACERAEIAAINIAEIGAWAEAHPDKKGKLTQTAAASAIKRVTLRAGLSNAPSPIEGMSMGALIGTSNRVGNGRAMEWKDGRRSGDELPV